MSLAYFYQNNPPTTITKKTQFLPVLNIPRRDFPLKTEVFYLLQKHKILADVLTFRDELQPQRIQNSEFILVDHHVSPFARQCVQIFDHRPYDTATEAPASCQSNLEQVGSCATLIAEVILRSGFAPILNEVLKLLHAAIVMDTVNFSIDAARATDKDHQIAEEIEQILCIDNSTELRLQLFRELAAAREDVSNLSSHQLLYKDMKIISNGISTIKIALPGYPINVQYFVRLPNAAQAVQSFAREVEAAVVLLIGMKISEDGSVHRDIGLINISNQQLFDAVLAKLLSSQEPNINLKEVKKCEFLNGKFYDQENIKATRKHILPLVKSVLDKWT